MTRITPARQRATPLLVAAGTAVVLAAAAPSHDARVQASMKTVVGPASDLLFAVGSEIDPDNGPSAAAAPPARWTAAAEAAGRLHDASLLLLKPEMVRPGSWTADARRMATLSEQAAASARARDGKTLTQAANDLGDTCTACHGKYKPQS